MSEPQPPPLNAAPPPLAAPDPAGETAFTDFWRRRPFGVGQLADEGDDAQLRVQLDLLRLVPQR